MSLVERAEGAVPSPLAGSGALPRAGGVDPNRIKLSWLVRLQWGGILGQTAAIAVVWALELVRLPFGRLLAIVAIEALGNLGLHLWARRARRVPEGAVAATMVTDALVLTVLLAFSGSYSNPFSTLYLVNVALGAVLLRPIWGWLLLGASLAAFGSLFALDELRHHGFALSELDHMELMRLHGRGMWVAFLVAAAFLVYIVHRVTRELAALEKELAAERSLSARKDKVAALATLAAGAAHEIATPLATIAVVTRELERSLEKGGPAGAQEDLDLIRGQLVRCQDILRQMSAHAGEHVGEPIVGLTLAEWAAAALDGLPGRERVAVRAPVDANTARLEGPASALARALRSLLKNALQATPADRPVELWLAAADGVVQADVVDGGAGMPPEVLARAGEPFYTTKQPGEGMGLGLFLAQTLA
ncbi:MAG TPA: ATP-binding protein, partial [Anaeromyxobacteraceae bacterium]